MPCVVGFRVPRTVKERVERLRKHVNWSEELRKYLVMRIEELGRARAERGC